MIRLHFLDVSPRISVLFSNICASTSFRRFIRMLLGHTSRRTTKLWRSQSLAARVAASNPTCSCLVRAFNTLWLVALDPTVSNLSRHFQAIKIHKHVHSVGRSHQGFFIDTVCWFRRWLFSFFFEAFGTPSNSPKIFLGFWDSIKFSKAQAQDLLFDAFCRRPGTHSRLERFCTSVCCTKNIKSCCLL